MATTVTLSAESKYGYSGQYIAHIKGRAERVQFNREFVGRRFGKRNESSSYETDEVGLYEECDVEKGGKSSSFVLVLPWKDGLRKLYSDKEDALAIAKRLDAGERIEDFVVAETGDVITETIRIRKCDVCGRHCDSYQCPDHVDAHVTPMTETRDCLNEDGAPKRKLVYAIRKPGEAKKAQAAATLDTAVDAIVMALQALPAPQQKQALKLAKEKLFPKADATESEVPTEVKE